MLGSIDDSLRRRRLQTVALVQAKALVGHACVWLALRLWRQLRNSNQSTTVHTQAQTQTMLLQRHCGELVDSRSLGQMLDLLKSEDVYEKLFARDALCLQMDAKVSKG